MRERKPSAERIYNLVTNLEIETFEDIRRDIDLYYKGYHFYYIIDTFDVIRYFLPFMEKNFFKIDEENPNKVANEIMAYDKIFALNQFHNIIIPTEYKFEILKKEKELEDKIKVLVENPVLKKFLGKVGKMDPRESEEFIQNNAEIFITLLILSNVEGKSHRSFHSFIKEKIQPSLASERIFEYFSEDDDHSSQDIESAVEYIYDKFVTNQTQYLLTLKSDLDRYRYLDNSYTDIQVIEKTRRLNSGKMRDTNGNGKSIFLYSSSAQTKSKTIFSILNDPSEEKYCSPGIEEYYPFNFYRSTLQLFLFMILTEEGLRDTSDPSKNGEEPKEILSFLVKVIEQKQIISFDQVGTRFPDFQKLLNKYSSAIDNHFYFNIYKNYKQIYYSKHKKFVKTEEVEKVFGYVDKYIKDKTNKSDLKYNIASYRQTHTLVNLLDAKSDIKASIRVPFGHDIIGNNFHHLPNLVFLYSADRDENFFTILFLINQITHDDDEDNIIGKIKPLIIKTFEGKTYDSNAYPNVGSIMSTYLNIFIDTRGEEEFNIEKETIYILKRLKGILTASGLRPLKEIAEGNEKLTGVVIKNPHVDEINYLLLWLLRRNERVEEGIDLGEKLIAENPADPRFKHGLALALISRCYAKPGIFNSALSPANFALVKKDFTKAAAFLRQCLEGYYLAIEKESKPDIKCILQSTLTAVLNSLVSSCIRLYELGNETSYELIIDSRLHIEEIKKLFNQLGLEYNQYQVYNTTEAELEYHEAKYNFDHDNLAMAHTKIIHSTIRIDTIKKAKKAHINAHFINIKERIDALRIRIFKKIGII